MTEQFPLIFQAYLKYLWAVRLQHVHGLVSLCLANASPELTGLSSDRSHHFTLSSWESASTTLSGAGEIPKIFVVWGFSWFVYYCVFVLFWWGGLFFFLFGWLVLFGFFWFGVVGVFCQLPFINFASASAALFSACFLVWNMHLKHFPPIPNTAEKHLWQDTEELPLQTSLFAYCFFFFLRHLKVWLRMLLWRTGLQPHLQLSWCCPPCAGQLKSSPGVTQSFLRVAARPSKR